MKTELPPFAVTGIGSLPSEDLEQAFALIEIGSPQIPYAPQLGAADDRQLMIPQLLSGLAEPILGSVGGGPYKVTPAQTRELFEAISAEANSDIILSPTRYSGLHELAARISNGKFPEAEAVKTQIVGPITAAGAFFCDQTNLATDYTFIDELSNLIAKTARAQIEFLKQSTGLPILIWLDEPILESFVTSSDRHLKNAGLDLLKNLIIMLRSSGAVVGIHCCSFPSIATLLSAQPDIISFDAWNGFDKMHVADSLSNLIESQTTLALGIVPTDRNLDHVSVVELKDKLEKGLGSLGHRYSDLKLLLTTACGLALNSTEQANRAFELLSSLRQSLLG